MIKTPFKQFDKKKKKIITDADLDTVPNILCIVKNNMQSTLSKTEPFFFS